MNKQQLASKIWESANKMRSKIEANEYKDYILGFIFYKFLSNKEVKFLKEHYYNDDTLKTVNEADHDAVEFLQKNIGYFISYDNLFTTWIDMGNSFDVSNVRDALSSFNRNIAKEYKKVFEGIFTTLETGLSKLGDTSKSQTKAIRDLIILIKDIPMDNKEDYDVLGFVYEYLISNFAANAGKKAGEFYTPHEVSILMSDIIAHELKNRNHIEIYDPTSGSGSLLINIGNSVSKYMNDPNGIKYYAQELKENTFNLTRMNLVMRGILPSNLYVRNGDTLEDDWPYFDESDPEHTYEPLYVDAVVSNPPYSQQWDPTDRETDPRYKEYGLAPKGKADYAFLLHDLFHLKSDGIMTIVLPHGVLFRGDSEGEIRKNLVEAHNIYAIIGLPANIFFGTGIPTIIMVLKKNRKESDIQIIDASKYFIKEGKNNKLRTSDIKRIVDAVIERKDIDKFSKIVTLEEIRKNDYNLNIPRYVDSSEEPETYDIYASMYGGIPSNELDKYNKYFNIFDGLKDNLFKKINDNYYDLRENNLTEYILNYKAVKDYLSNYENLTKKYTIYLNDKLINNMNTIDNNSIENEFASELFKLMNNIELLDNYKAYQVLDDAYTNISNDLETIHKEGFDSCTEVIPNMITKKKDGKDIEVQDGFKGKIIPFDIVQKYYLNDELNELSNIDDRLSEIESYYQEVFDEMSEEEKEQYSDVLNDDSSAFKLSELKKLVKQFKKDNEIFNAEQIESKFIEIDKLSIEEKELKAKQKELYIDLQDKTKNKIESLTGSEVYELLKEKWILPIENNLNNLISEELNNFSKELNNLANKYKETFSDLESKINSTEKDLVNMLDELTGNDFDMKGIEELKQILGGNPNE